MRAKTRAYLDHRNKALSGGHARSKEPHLDLTENWKSLMGDGQGGFELCDVVEPLLAFCRFLALRYCM
jgi:hypothetical protein